uniref:Cyclin dependent kinase 2 associated protein 1 n=1 Tax=Suricata suricatta TaxID=37032 RepID=A0A673V737_SURSU
MAASSQYRQLLSDYGPPSLGYTQGTGNSQVPQSKYAELLAIIEELGKEIRPTYAGSKSAMERLKRGKSWVSARQTAATSLPGADCCERFSERRVPGLPVCRYVSQQRAGAAGARVWDADRSWDLMERPCAPPGRVHMLHTRSLCSPAPAALSPVGDTGPGEL